MCFGGGSKTTVVVPPPPEPSPEEVRQNQLTNQLLELNISAQGFDIIEGPDGPSIVERPIDPEVQAQQEADKARERLLQDRLFESIKALTPDEGQLAENRTRERELQDKLFASIEALSPKDADIARDRELQDKLFASVEALTPDEAQLAENRAREQEFQDKIFASIEALSPDEAQLAENREIQSAFNERILASLDPQLTERQLEIQDLAEQRQLEELTASGEPSERTKELVGESFKSARTRGEEDIQRFATELAGRKGFEKGDSPIANAAFRAQTDLTTGLRSAEAGALLDVGQRNQLFGQSLREFQSGLDFDRFSQAISAGQFSQGRSLNSLNSILAAQGSQAGQNLNSLNSILAAQRFQSGQNLNSINSILNAQGFQQGRNLNSINSLLAIQDFQNALRQQATQNRLNLGTAAGNLASLSANTRLAGFQPQLVKSSTTGINLGGIAQGIGAALGPGFGPGGFFGSSQTFKDNLEALEASDYEAVLKSLQQTPIYRWTYKPEFNDGRRHIGPITEQAPREMVTEDGMAVVPIDYLGFMLAALKGLQAKVNKLEAQNGSI